MIHPCTSPVSWISWTMRFFITYTLALYCLECLTKLCLLSYFSQLTVITDWLKYLPTSVLTLTLLRNLNLSYQKDRGDNGEDSNMLLGVSEGQSWLELGLGQCRVSTEVCGIRRDKLAKFDGRSKSLALFSSNYFISISHNFATLI